MRDLAARRSLRPLLRKRRTERPSPITPEHAACLASMLNRPTRYRQRCLDQVSFLPEGGQQWVRTLQTQIPKKAGPKGSEWRIVSLGEYERRRSPDFTITDAHGTRLDRLTRRQHGVALTKALLATHFFNLPENRAHRLRKDPKARVAYERLRDVLYDTLTSVNEFTVQEELDIAKKTTKLFTYLLISVGVPTGNPGQDNDVTKRLPGFARDLASSLNVLQYLCWVKAEPGEILNLRVSWTIRDPLSSLISRGGLRAGLSVIRRGLVRDKRMRRDAWMRWYCEFGLAPMSYAFRTPKAGSYYFTIEPPAKTDVIYLDWESSNSFEDAELDSGFASAHLHDRDVTSHQVRSHAVRAYVRCRTREHKQIAAGALLNVVFVWLAARGRFTSSVGTSAQTWLLVTPTILIAYLAEQQRHYYAHTTRRQRGILWLYLATSVIFLVTLTFSLSHGEVGSQHWGVFARLIAWLFASFSTAVFVWYTPLGYNYQLTTEKWAKAWIKNKGRKRAICKIGKWGLCATDSDRQAWEIYNESIRKYCNRVFRAVLILPLCVLAAIILAWHYPQKQHHKKKSAQTVQRGTLTTTVWPSEYCKGEGCNVEFRFVPNAAQTQTK